jgi:hypothetical protein
MEHSYLRLTILFCHQPARWCLFCFCFLRYWKEESNKLIGCDFLWSGFDNLLCKMNTPVVVSAAKLHRSIGTIAFADKRCNLFSLAATAGRVAAGMRNDDATRFSSIGHWFGGQETTSDSKIRPIGRGKLCVTDRVMCGRCRHLVGWGYGPEPCACSWPISPGGERRSPR